MSYNLTRSWDGELLVRLHRTFRMEANEFVAVEGPVERRGDRLVLRVPLDAGGDKLRQLATATSYEEDNRLVLELPEWLARRMQLCEGSAVHLDNRFGKLNISRLP